MGHVLHWPGDRLAASWEAIAKDDTFDGSAVVARRGVPKDCPLFDPSRFVTYASVNGAGVVTDIFGQTFVLDRAGKLACILFVRLLAEFAAWTPAGHRLGPVEVIGGPATPDAELHVGRALRLALSGEV